MILGSHISFDDIYTTFSLMIMDSALLKLGSGVQNEWREFERRAPFLPVVLSDYCLATEPPRTFWDRWNVKRIWNAQKRKRELTYVSLRRRFVDVRSNHPVSMIMSRNNRHS
jgi:hypothetical protein